MMQNNIQNPEPDDFYKKEFICGNSILTREYLESYPCPFCTNDVSDTQMQKIVEEVDAEVRRVFNIPEGQLINFDDDEQEDFWNFEIDNTAFREKVPYYEDIFKVYHGMCCLKVIIVRLLKKKQLTNNIKRKNKN